MDDYVAEWMEGHKPEDLISEHGVQKSKSETNPKGSGRHSAGISLAAKALPAHGKNLVNLTKFDFSPTWGEISGNSGTAVFAVD